MDIQLEQIELVKDRTGVSYKEAKEALEFAEGNVVDAIIYIEENINHEYEQHDSTASNVVNSIKEVIKKGNISKVRIYKGDDLIVNIPVTVGAIAAVAFPWGVLASAVASAAVKCRVELVKSDGSIVDINEKAGSAVESIKNKGGVVVDEIKDKGSDFYKAAVDKGTDIYKSAVEKGTDIYENVKSKGVDFYQDAVEKGTDLYNDVKSKSMDIYEDAKSKGGEIYENTKAQVEEYLNKRKAEEGFDFSDLDIEQDDEEVLDFADLGLEEAGQTENGSSDCADNSDNL